jgi:hypothetical protein
MSTGKSIGVPEGLRVIHSSEVCAIGEFERCMMSVWHLQPTYETFDLRNRELKQVAARHPGKCGYVDVIEPGSKAPPDQLRKLAVQVFRDVGKDLACIAFVVDESGLQSALKRSVLTTLTFLLPQVQPSKVFKKPSDMAEWMRSRIGHEPEFNARLVSALDSLRRVPPQGSSVST